MRKHLLIVFLFLWVSGVQAQEIMRFTVKGSSDLINCPVSVSLDNLLLNGDNQTLHLYETEKGKEHEIDCQLENGATSLLWFILPGTTKTGQERHFVLKYELKKSSSEKISIHKDHLDLSLSKNGAPILKYRYAETFPPEGVNPIYRRSGFIHPLVSPEGEVLTRIQAPDHYHHYGIWGPWTLTHIQGREVDFWNLVKGQGTVRFASFLNQLEGPVFSGFNALQQHIDFGAKGGDQVALNEQLVVRNWNISEKKWLIDYTSILNCPLDSGILFDAYRYGGGIGFRATEKWNKDNCTVLTSEGKTRLEADGSNARWCIVEGESSTPSGRSGILFMSHPTNRMHPEPMRVWPSDANGGQGNMYFEFCPIRHKEWKIERGQNYSQRYRMVVFDGAMSAGEAEQWWQAFAHPPQVETEKLTKKK